MKLNKRKCIECKTEFQKIKPLQSCCSNKCAIERSKRQSKISREKKNRKDTAEKKKDLMTKPEWMNLLQATFNTFIRLRDEGLPCISCQGTKDVQYAAGHYIPTTYSYLRFNEFNVNRQCNQYCNMHLRGNIHEYRKNLIKKIGLKEVEKLESDKHLKLELSIPEIKELITEYKFKIKELKKK